MAGDFDGNLVVDASDIPGFVSALNHAGVPGEYISQVPEPGTGLLVMGGVLGLAAMRRKRE